MGLLSDIGKGLFGGGGGGGGSFIDPAQQPYLDFLRSQGQGIAQDQLGPGGAGDTASALSGNLLGQGQGFLGGLGQNAGQQLDPFIGEGYTGAQIDALGQTTQQNFGDLIGQIGSSAVGSGGFGGTRQGVAEGIGAGRASTGYSLGVADILQQDFGRRQDAATSQAGIQAQSGLGGISSLGSLYNLGMAPFEAQFDPLMQLNQLVGQPTQLGRETEGTSRGITQGFSDVFGGGAAGAAAMFSDSRLKQDIIALGEYNGHQWYEYSYLWDKVRRIGVMAEEAIKVSPQAVSRHASGYLMVDYGRL